MKVEEKLENAVVLAEGLKRKGFCVEVRLCNDMPCLSAYMKPTVKDAKLLKYVRKEK